MRVLLATTGSEGDFQPFLALAERLQRAGHQTTLAAADRYGEQARQAGVAFAAIGHPWSEATTREQFSRVLALRDPLKQLALVVELLEREQVDSVPRLRELARAHDLVVYPPLLVAAVAAARAEHVQHVSVHLAPLHRARSYSPLGPSFGRFVNAALWGVAGTMLRRASDVRLNRVVAAAGLAPWHDVMLSASHSSALDLIAVSPTVLTRDALLPAQSRITGYFFRDQPGPEPSAELAAFVAQSPPIVIGFGSMTGFDAERMTRIVLDAVADTKQNVVLQSGWAGLGALTLPPHVMRAGFVSHAWLHARAACVVHHGGAGTSASVLRAGVPQAIVWHLGDQPMWGRRMHDLGCAPAPCVHHDLDAVWLRRTVQRLSQDPSMRARAAELGAAVRAEDGTGQAVTALEALHRAGSP